MFSRLSVVTLCAGLSLSPVAITGCGHGGTRAVDDEAADIFSYRSIPDGSERLKDECACLNVDIRRIRHFTENMKRSPYASHYLAMGRQSVDALQRRAREIDCSIELE